MFLSCNYWTSFSIRGQHLSVTYKVQCSYCQLLAVRTMFWCSSQHKQGILNSGLIKNPIMPYKKTGKASVKVPTQAKADIGCKLDVKSKGMEHVVCKLAVFSHILPVKSPRLLGVGVLEIRLVHLIDLHVYMPEGIVYAVVSPGG